MRTLGFSCAYVRSVDDEDGTPCGRRATRRKYGEPKCLGHWVVEYLLSMAGGTQHARKTWTVASIILLFFAATSGWWLRATTLPHAITAVLLTGGLVICFHWEHPLGGVISLVGAALTALAWARGNLFGYYLLHPEAKLADFTRAETLFVTSLDAQVVVMFTFSLAGFYFNYRENNTTELKWWRGLSFTMLIVLFVSVLVYAFMTSGKSAGLVQWMVVVFGAMAIARGGRVIRKLAAILRV